MKTRELSLQEIQEAILDIMIYIDEICRKHHLTYFLSGGTLIGAIREKGFIPWDDDADIMMPRQDYNKLLQIIRKDSSLYKINSVELSKEWTLPIAKVYDTKTLVDYKYIQESPVGVFVDILPMDGLSGNRFLTKLYYCLIKFLWMCRHSAIKKDFNPEEKFRYFKKVFQKIMPFIGANRISKFINSLAKHKHYQESEYVGCSVLCHYMDKEYFAKSWFESSIDVEFCNHSFKAPIGYDAYLTKLYGDYMTPPKKADDHHHMSIYYL